MANISLDEVKHTADLARIAVTDEEAEQLTSYLNAMTEYVDQLAEVDTEGVEPTIHLHSMKNILRKDEPQKWTSREDILQNAPDHKDGQFRVPSILE